MASPSTDDRKQERHWAEIEAHVTLGPRHLVTVTRDISASGLFFFAQPPPGAGQTVHVTLLPGDAPPIGLTAVVRFVIPDLGAGVELIGGDGSRELARYRELVEQHIATARAWSAVGGFVRASAEPSAEITSGSMRAPGAVLLERGPGDPEARWTSEFEQRELIEVGEHCEAFRILFERHPAISPERSKIIGMLGERGHALSGVSREPVTLKLHGRDRLRTANIGATWDMSGFVAILPPEREGAGPAVYSLSGRELLVIRQGERTVFPHFDERDLRRIQKSVVRSFGPRGPQGAPASDAGSTVGGWATFNRATEQSLVELFELLRPETRVYTIGRKAREVRLLRHVKVLLRTQDEPSERPGVLLHDGKRVCVLLESIAGSAMQVHALSESDEILVTNIEPR